MRAGLGNEARDHRQVWRCVCCDMCGESRIYKHYPHPQSRTDHLLFSSSFARLLKTLQDEDRISPACRSRAGFCPERLLHPTWRETQ